MLAAHLVGSITNLGGRRVGWHQKPLPLIVGLKGGCSPEWFDLLDLDCFGVEYGELPSLNPWRDEESPWALGRPIASESREEYPPLSTASASSGISSKVCMVQKKREVGGDQVVPRLLNGGTKELRKLTL